MTTAAILNRVVQRLSRELAPPSTRLHPFVVDGRTAGWLNDTRAWRAALFDDVFERTSSGLWLRPAIDGPEARTAALESVARALAGEGLLTAWRDERYAVAAAAGDPPLFYLERAAARFFGIATRAVHVNATTARDGMTAMWIARRSPHKSIDAGLLDNLVGGGIAADAAIESTLVKEAWEEAGIPAAVASSARRAGCVAIFREQPDGIENERIHVHDLTLPFHFE
ncbi:MAG TPA: DUF4743 domain-containing protein, partial [Casimicrobiaceae bacterium]|nr:DUF4743 domain-containing protein [Casimicrobiaceae bacterium]